MIKSLAAGTILALGLANVCNAAVAPMPVDDGASAIVRVAEDCGADWWRDVYGHCHPFHNGAGNMRGTHEACPTWAHWYAGRCVHN
jgi:hypothetical protein